MHHGIHRAVAPLALLAALLSGAPAAAQDAPSVTAPAGFKVDLVYTAPKEEGSWVSMTFDPKGRILVSPEKGKLRRVTLPQTDQAAKSEELPAAVGDAQGLCWAFDSLYVNGAGPDGPGLYRLKARDAESFEDAVLLKKWSSAGEQGSHAVVAGPDQKLYLVNGGRVKVPEGLSPKSPYRDYREDQLLPRLEDPKGPAAGIQVPGGHILRTDAEGKEWELWCGGLYNPYDLAFNADGEPFTVDADTEAELGTPWYVPAQVFHVVSGGEYGWRPGSSPWPSCYHDRLPAAADAGRAAPTGLAFGDKARFPAKYRRAFFVGDWAGGRILAVHLQAKGATYAGTVEPFITGKPLPVTDIEIGLDGAMYFITGGRGAESRLYRVTGTGAPGAPPPNDPDAAAARRQRRELEKCHSQQDRKFVQTLWPELSHECRFMRFAARVGLERQELRHWAAEGGREIKEQSACNTMLALARVGGPGIKESLLKSLQRHPWGTIETDEFRTAFVRTYAVLFCRLGPAPEDMIPFIKQRFEEIYPDAQNESLNRELCRMLVYLKVPEGVEKTIALLPRLKTPEDEMYYISCLRVMKEGWTPDRRQTWRAWFDKTAGYKGGASFAAYLAALRSEGPK
jgi:hypothetical protein